ncbi:hypothetical protein TL18_05305 [Methanobrevibacter sp. YE315]|uniref:hypothetical protein n=1 Tax=Methanobrevibacter sp. YE315 TaxID=1609968 RepID=UPI000764DFB7|nr:hypothetical protein [Methanobrevibacter sp. YE315]AMD17485.1 hypothetical protein TL18_05305 [Methanobrevibacter sp. YE315]
MDSFEALIGKHIDEVALNESPTFFIASLEYFYKNCGRRYPASKFKLADLDYFNLIEFADLFKHESVLIIWYNEDGIITDLELYYLSNDFDVLFKDYYYIKKAIENGEAHRLTEGDTRYLGAARLNEKVRQPNSEKLANKRELVLKKKYLQKIINELGYKCR